jgi:CheY-like chemotaxis protein
VSKKIRAILLVDDDQDDQLLFHEALSEADTSVACLSAVNGIDALEKLNSGSIAIPDVIFMDVNMPKMNGLDCLLALQKSPGLKAIPVIMYSTYCSSDFQKKCTDNGAIGYIEKPTDFWQLCGQLKHILKDGTGFLKNNIPAES